MRRVTKVPHVLRVCVTSLTISSSKSLSGALHLVDGPLLEDRSHPVDIILQRGGKCVKKSVSFGPESSFSSSSGSAGRSPFRAVDFALRSALTSQDDDGGDVTRTCWEGEAALTTELTLSNSAGGSEDGDGSSGDLLSDKSYDLHVTASDHLELACFSIDVSKFVSYPSSSAEPPPRSLANRIELSSSTSLPVPSERRGFGSTSACNYVDEGIVTVHLVAYVTCVARPPSLYSPSSFSSPKYSQMSTPPSVVPPEDAFDTGNDSDSSDGSEGYNSDASSTAVDKSHYDAMSEKVAYLNEQVSLWKGRAASLREERLQLESEGSAVLSRLSTVLRSPAPPMPPPSSVLSVFAGVDVLLESANRAKALDSKLVGLRAQGELLHRHRAALEAKLDVASSAEKQKLDKLREMEKAVEGAKERERIERDHKGAIAARHMRLVGEIQKKGAADSEFEAEKAKHEDWIEQLWSDSDDDQDGGGDDDDGARKGKGFDSGKGVAIARLRTKNNQLKDLIVSLGQSKRNLTHSVVSAEALASKRADEIAALKHDLARAKDVGKASDAEAARRGEQLRAKEDEVSRLVDENARKDDEAAAKAKELELYVKTRDDEQADIVKRHHQEMADFLKKHEQEMADIVKKHEQEMLAALNREQELKEVVAQRDKNAAERDSSWESKYATLAQLKADEIEDVKKEWSKNCDALADDLKDVKMKLAVLTQQREEEHHRAQMQKRASTTNVGNPLPPSPKP